MGVQFEAFFKRIGWMEVFSQEFPLPKEVIVEQLQQHTDIGHSFGLFEVFSSNNKPYTGLVNTDSFALRRRRKVIDFNMGMAQITGTINGSLESTQVHTIVAFSNLLAVSIISIFIIFYGLVIALIGLGVFGDDAAFILPLVAIQGVVLAFIFYFILRQEIKISKRSFEKDLKTFMDTNLKL